MMQLEGLGKLIKKSMTSSGLKTTNFQLAAQTYRMPPHKEHKFYFG
jgi:hypothetical protein